MKLGPVEREITVCTDSIDDGFTHAITDTPPVTVETDVDDSPDPASTNALPTMPVP
ncbi:unannotated protein [freshwater metagenome]|uniref:Unannotated protein n=1 Tax=freshwater metagenome TaxID=449393 RepID=A0A6J6G247_9ZZZZ